MTTTAPEVAPPDVETSPPPGESGLTLALAKLLGVLAIVVGFCILTHSVGVLIVVLALVAMVMLHELGHFATAKWSGMKVTEYFFGFGPRLWSVVKGETTYGVKALPAGGYVRIVGMTMLEEVTPTDEPRSYRQGTFPRRVLVASAGSLTHFLLAFILIWSMLLVGGSSTATATSPKIDQLLTFSPGPTPSRVAGLRKGDVFVSIDGHPAKTFAELSTLISENPGKTLQIAVLRDGTIVHLHVTPVRRTVCEGNPAVPKTVGQIGVLLSTDDVKTTNLGPLGALRSTPSQFGDLFGGTFAGIGTVFSLHGLRSFGHDVATAGHQSTCVASGGATSSSSSSSGGQILSFLGFIELGSQALKQGVPLLLYLLALVNIFIGVVNLFPMLPLDGGHVAIAVYERLRSRKGRRYHADVAKLLPLSYVFLAFIIVIGLGALYVNILQPARLPGG